MKRFALKSVFSGFVTAWRFAIWPTRISPLSSHATTLGVMREPSSFTITLGSRPSMMATTLFVVPRSIPIILPMVVRLQAGADSGVAAYGHQELRFVLRQRTGPLLGSASSSRGQANHTVSGVNGPRHGIWRRSATVSRIADFACFPE